MKKTIRLGTFNLYQFAEPPYSWYKKKDKFTQQQWDTKRAWIKEQIIKMECDIIGFQEVFSHAALEKLVNELGFEYFATVDTPKLHKQTYTSTTVAIASKYQITKTQKVKVNYPSFEKHDFVGHYAFARVPLKATISLPKDQEIVVYVVHFKSNRLNEFEYIFRQEHTLEQKQKLVQKILADTPSTSLRQRLCEASSLFANIKRLKDKPVALLCDLNDKEFSLCIDALSNPKYHDPTSMEESLLSDAYYLYEHIEKNPHPEAKEPTRKPTSYFLGKGNVLDYVFVSKHFEVIGYEVLDEHLHGKSNDLIFKSDHGEVVCELNIKTKKRNNE